MDRVPISGLGAWRSAQRRRRWQRRLLRVGFFLLLSVGAAMLAVLVLRQAIG